MEQHQLDIVGLNFRHLVPSPREARLSALLGHVLTVAEFFPEI